MGGMGAYCLRVNGHSGRVNSGFSIAVTVFGNTLTPHGTLRAFSINTMPARNARINPGIASELVFFLRSREMLHNIRFRQTSDF